MQKQENQFSALGKIHDNDRVNVAMQNLNSNIDVAVNNGKNYAFSVFLQVGQYYIKSVVLTIFFNTLFQSTNLDNILCI